MSTKWDKSRAETWMTEYWGNFRFKKEAKVIAERLGLPILRNGRHTVRNEKGWRENEVEVEYVWMLDVSRSFVGFGGLFSVKFKESEFRDFKNPEKLIQGIFKNNPESIEYHFVEKTTDFSDRIAEISFFDIFHSNDGIVLDGVDYQFWVCSNNMESMIYLNNPNIESWKKWEKEVWILGRSLAEKSGKTEFIELFE